MENIDREKNTSLHIVFGDVVMGIHGKDFSYLFSYQTGGPESIVVKGKEWLYRTPKPTFWRATTDNDRGSGFSFRSAMWMGADMFIQTTGIRVWVDKKEVRCFKAPYNNRYDGMIKANNCTIQFLYRTATKPAAWVSVTYTIENDGRILVKAHYKGKKSLPQLPAFGLRFIMPTAADGYDYCGLSGETYPDRMNGGVRGNYHVDGLPVTPYLVPQDCGMHMETQSLIVIRSTTLDNTRKINGEPFSLSFKAEERPFAFSCLPYTAEELENAVHQEELPPVRRTVVCIFGAVRGVGGIDSWGSDVASSYHVRGDANLDFSFSIIPSSNF